MNRTLWLSAVAAVVVGAVHCPAPPPAGAQSGTRSDGRSFEARFWDYLQRAQYRNWGPGPVKGTGFYEGQSPHGAWLKAYWNREALGNAKDPQSGSIIIKENFSKDKKLMAITIMYRSKGYDPEHNDWYWVKYNPDGSVARTPAGKGGKPIAGRFSSCIDCHSSADGDDYLFEN